MKRNLIALIGLVLINSCVHVSLPRDKNTYKASLYEYFVIAEGGSQGSINNLGEVVYMAKTGIFSTTRGRLEDPSYAKRFPQINDSGEVVYCGAEKSNGEGPWTVYSTVRSKVAYGFTPSINNLGEIVYIVEEGHRLTIKSTTRDLSATVNHRPTGYHLDINNSGEVVYKVNNQIFSTTRGMITTIVEGTPSGITINNFGDILYSNVKGVFYMDGTNLTTEVSKIFRIARFGGPVDVNDHGDFVFNIRFNETNISLLLLATQRPEYYKRKYIPLKNFLEPMIHWAIVPLSPH